MSSFFFFFFAFHQKTHIKKSSIVFFLCVWRKVEKGIKQVFFFLFLNFFVIGNNCRGVDVDNDTDGDGSVRFGSGSFIFFDNLKQTSYLNMFQKKINL